MFCNDVWPSRVSVMYASWDREAIVVLPWLYPLWVQYTHHRNIVSFYKHYTGDTFSVVSFVLTVDRNLYVFLHRTDYRIWQINSWNWNELSNPPVTFVLDVLWCSSFISMSDKYCQNCTIRKYVWTDSYPGLTKCNPTSNYLSECLGEPAHQPGNIG